MNADPTTNMVVFLLARGEGEHAIAGAPTQADDCVRQAWDRASREHRARPDEVTAIYTEWEASDKDNRFIAETFPRAELSHSFTRPTDGDWEPAFAAARQAMADAEQRREAQDAAGRMEHVRQNGELLPVLWSASAPNAPLMRSTMPHWALVQERLFFALATVGPTPTGNIGMDHLTHDGHQRLGAPPLHELFARAADGLRRGLQIDAHSSERGQLLTMRRDGGMCASAVALPDFYQRMSQLLGDERIVVGLPSPDELAVAGAASGWPETLREMVLSSPYPTGELVPSLLLIDRSGVQLLAERG
ncbi:hypothetical protein [Rugosimonospora africana]|uniref:Uncharacterized protein n=1 Tax=Rugosimonospora africana TaxID=556532 RepID=A0A8J3QPE4_9ACTN|nr:hypothetical protein [Rugosimonospora africana]GIH13028.1 hypothetical protein Raf01_12000 [Rugosimonospora africana]